MASFLFHIGRFCHRHKWWVIAAWLAAAVAVLGLVVALNPKFAKDFELPGTDSSTAAAQLEQYFPQAMAQQGHAAANVFVAADDGIAAHSAQIDALVADLQALPDATDPATIVNPLLAAQAIPALASSLVGDDGRVGLIQVQQNIDVSSLKTSNKDQLTRILDEHRGGGLHVEATGSLMQVKGGGATAELIGFTVAYVVMVIAFGALVAGAIPLVTAVVGVVIAMCLVYLGAEVMSINEAATSIVLMLGIAVSIDYALFIVSRYRTELARGGSREDAVGRAVGTAGSAVVFAGLTVIIAVVALMVVGIPLITQMGAGAGIAVAIAVLTALTLIPALLGAFGRRVFTPKISWIRHAEEVPGVDTNGVRFGRAVVRRPVPFIVVGLAVLVLAAIPLMGIRLGLVPTADAEVPGVALQERGFGAGVNGPLLVVLHTESGDIAPAAQQAVEQIQTLDDVARPETLTWQGNGPTEPNTGADAAFIYVTPMSSPSSSTTTELMKQIRALAPSVEAAGGELHVGGTTAVAADLSATLTRALVPYLVVVVGLAFLIMIAVFRSIWVPLIGTLGFVFSVLATFGITVAIFQDGALGLISNTQPILSFLPIILIGLVFGLAMDYQVFLMTRMREEYLHGLPAKEAIIAGYRHGARVVTSAALIMISVFTAFMLSPDTTAKMIGFALAVAVLFDAFIIRMMVVPAVIALLGDRAWGLPKWLDKLVPNLDMEGGAVRDLGIPIDAPAPGEPEAVHV